MAVGGVRLDCSEKEMGIGYELGGGLRRLSLVRGCWRRSLGLWIKDDFVTM